jgi:hypothetical protein
LTALFNRDAKITIDNIEITSRDTDSKQAIANQIRFSFKTNMHAAWSSNSCEIKIYNLSENKRKIISQGLVLSKKVTVEAGYLNSIKTIFVGVTFKISHVRNQVDWITTIKCIDGRAVDNRKRINFSLGKGAKIIDVIKRISSEITVINTENMIKKYRSLVPGFEDFENGVAVKGIPLEQLFILLNAAGWEASVQNSEVVIVEKNETTGYIIELNEDSGLIGGVEVGIAFVRATSLLNGDIFPGRRIRLNTELIENAEFKVNRALHIGDTFGNEWFTKIELRTFG